MWVDGATGKCDLAASVRMKRLAVSNRLGCRSERTSCAETGGATPSRAHKVSEAGTATEREDSIIPRFRALLH